MSEQLTAAIRAALAAGALLRQEYGRPHQVEHKGPIDLVTEVDRQSQALVIGILTNAFPAYGVLSEEGLDTAESGDTRWVIDPLDGTANFAHQYPLFAVSIALQKGRQMELGVVYNPLLNELFTAERGKGAQMNGRAIQVSACQELGNALVGSGFPYDIWSNPIDNLEEWGQMAKRAQNLHSDGSATLDLCHVASGRLDAFWELDLDPWDLAAGSLIVQEAGGRVTHLDGEPFVLGGRSVLASNGLIHQVILDVVGEPRSSGS
jgi:myo-inositol-1(or 4)-monophosphatase